MISPIFTSRLFWKAFLSLLLGLLVWFPIFYGLTVPHIHQLAFEVEETAARNVVVSLTETVRHSKEDLEAWRLLAMESHKRDLRNVVDVVESMGRHFAAEARPNAEAQSQARRRYLEWLRDVRFGDKDYVWVADFNNVLVSHPDRRMNQRDVSSLRDLKGNLVIPEMVGRARQSGDGFYSYWWPRLGDGQPSEKLSYFRLLPEWQLVIGSGVYLDDIEAEVAKRREILVADMRERLKDVHLAKSGYVFIFDGNYQILVHPDQQLLGSSMRALIDPGTGRPLVDEMIEAVRERDGMLRYHWNHPSDTANYRHEKLAWVFYVPEYDWYIGASVYVDELQQSGNFLRTSLLAAFAAGLLTMAIGAFLFIRHLTVPILRLADTARRQKAGDLSATCDIRQNDEIGELGKAFNGMVGTLKEQIETLESRVEARTRELENWAGKLEQLVEERTSEVLASEAKFRALLEQSLAGIFVVQGGRFVYVNATFARIFDYDSADEIINRISPADLIVEQDQAIILPISTDIEQGVVESDERSFRCKRRDGSLIDVNVSGRSLTYNGRPAMLGLVLDVTEQKHAERAREQALAAAEHLSRLKSEFMANMSHELRTPLNAIIGMARIGQRSEDLAKAHEVSGYILASGRHLLDLVMQVLDFSSLEKGALPLQATSCDLPRLLDEISTQWQHQAQLKGLAFTTHLAADTPSEFHGDAARLRQLLDILLDNAVKFTRKGRISLQAEADATEWRIGVADTGIGLSPAQLQTIFHPFEQVDGSQSRQFGGMGLGLALSQRLAGLMGGHISVSSEVGHGTRFVLHLPRRIPSDEQPPQRSDEDQDFVI